MKKLIPISRFDKTKDNSDSLKARFRNKGADKVNLELYARAENIWMSLSTLRRRRVRAWPRGLVVLPFRITISSR